MAFIIDWRVVHCNDYHHLLCRYWPEVPYIDIEKGVDLTSHMFQNLDYIASVCPCAGLSKLNTSRGTKACSADAEQNQWMYKSSDFILDKIKPKVLWGENAPGLFSGVGEGVLEKLRQIGQRYNYSFSVIKTILRSFFLV